MTSPSHVTRSRTPKRSSSGTRGGGSYCIEIVEFRARLSSDGQHVFKTTRHDQGGARAASLEQRVGADGCSVHDFEILKCNAADG